MVLGRQIWVKWNPWELHAISGVPSDSATPAGLDSLNGSISALSDDHRSL